MSYWGSLYINIAVYFSSRIIATMSIAIFPISGRLNAPMYCAANATNKMTPKVFSLTIVFPMLLVYNPRSVAPELYRLCQRGVRMLFHPLS